MPTSSTEAAELDLLLETPQLLAVNKPAGMPTQPDPTGDRSLLEHVEAHAREQLPGGRIGMPHRIDRPVSGAVLFTRTEEALTCLNTLFREGLVHKTYLAIVEGRTAPEARLEHRLLHDPKGHKARLSDAGVPVYLHYRTIANGDRFSLIEVHPQGGAFHQIRAQLAAAGHPIKGDVKYGARRGERDRSIALHARELMFDHPLFGGHVHVLAPAPTTGIWPALLASSQERSGQ